MPAWNCQWHKIMDKLSWISDNQVLSGGCTKDKWIINFFLLFCNRRRVGLTVFFMGAILYALFLVIFSHYLYCDHHFKADNSNGITHHNHNETFEVSETNKTTATIAGFFQFLRERNTRYKNLSRNIVSLQVWSTFLVFHLAWSPWPATKTFVASWRNAALIGWLARALANLLREKLWVW